MILNFPKVLQYYFLQSSPEPPKDDQGSSPGYCKMDIFCSGGRLGGNFLHPQGQWCFILNPLGDILGTLVCYVDISI